MTRPTLQIILGSTRPSRQGIHVARWVTKAATTQGDFRVELIDLAEVALPLLDEPNHPSQQLYTQQHTIAWSSTIRRADAFILVVPEYNHSFPASLKNALDYLFVEWANKPVGLVSYGGISAGLRSATALKPVLLALRMMPVLETVSIPNVGERVSDEGFQAYDEVDASLDAMLAELSRTTNLLRSEASLTK